MSECLCTETWNVIPLCEGETQTRYVYGFWVHPDCTLHGAQLTQIEKELRSWRDEA